MRARYLLVALVLAALWVFAGGCHGKGSPSEPTPACAVSISPAGLTFAADGGPGSVSVTAPAGCAWSVTASAGWITVSAGLTGTGAGTVGYSVAVNAGSESRSGALTIAGQNHTVTQQGRPPTACSYDISPASADFGKDAATGTFGVSAANECRWTAVSDAAWLTVVEGSQGSGSARVSYAVARNLDTAERNGSIAVADRRFTVRQSGDVGGCRYSVEPVLLSPCMPAGTLKAAVTTQAFCPWTATPNASWLSVPGGASGSGSGEISIAFPDNYDAPRNGVIMVRWPTPTAGQNIRVEQAGCVYAVSRSDFGFSADEGVGRFDVLQESLPNTCGGPLQDRCVWSAQSDVPWITITTGMPRSGDNPVTFAVGRNDGAASRSGRITVRDQVVRVTQAGR